MLPTFRLRLARSAYEAALAAARDDPSALAWARLLRAGRNLREAQRDVELDRAGRG
jgi:hypothetical protein